MKKTVTGFFDFIRERGVVSLAIGFLIGGAVTQLVGSFVKNIVNPFVGVLTGSVTSLADKALQIGPITLMWGSFVSDLINFVIICAVVYFGFMLLGLDKLDKKKE